MKNKILADGILDHQISSLVKYWRILRLTIDSSGLTKKIRYTILDPYVGSPQRWSHLINSTEYMYRPRNPPLLSFWSNQPYRPDKSGEKDTSEFKKEKGAPETWIKERSSKEFRRVPKVVFVRFFPSLSTVQRISTPPFGHVQWL